MLLDKAIKDIKGLGGSSVQIFGQPVTLNVVNDDDILIDVVDVLNRFGNYEASSKLSAKILSAYYDDTRDDLIEIVEGGNTYNFGNNLNHDIQYHEIKFNDHYYIIASVHRYGDVRGNYTDDFVLDMTFDEFIDEINNCYKSINIEVDGVDYVLDVMALSDGVSVYSVDGDELGTIYVVDRNDAIDEIKSLINEVQ